MKSPEKWYSEAFARSHPSRGAWIEIVRACPAAPQHIVAPLAGCVD